MVQNLLVDKLCYRLDLDILNICYLYLATNCDLFFRFEDLGFYNRRNDDFYGILGHTPLDTAYTKRPIPTALPWPKTGCCRLVWPGPIVSSFFSIRFQADVFRQPWYLLHEWACLSTKLHM